MNKIYFLAIYLLIFFSVEGCVSRHYYPGPPDCPFNQLKLGQTYADMIEILGKPDRSESEDRKGRETAILFIPGWNIVESIGDFNPSMLQIYTYDRWGVITIDNNNHIVRVEAKSNIE